MNLQMFERIKDQILFDPDNFNMSDFRCGTSFCIAGWAIAFDAADKNEKLPNNESFCLFGEERGAKILGITTFINDPEKMESDEFSQADKLFYTNNWPETFKLAHWDNNNKEFRAKNACARIDHFIATEGKE